MHRPMDEMRQLVRYVSSTHVPPTLSSSATQQLLQLFLLVAETNFWLGAESW